MAYAKKGKKIPTNISQQPMASEQTPGSNKLPKTPLTGKQKVGYAMRGARKVLKMKSC